MPQKKEDIYVILGDGRVLHAVKTLRQAKQFVNNYEREILDLLGYQFHLGGLDFVKIKLFHPRELSSRQLKTVKETLKNEKTHPQV